MRLWTATPPSLITAEDVVLSNMQFKTGTQLKLLLPTTITEDGPMQCPTFKQNSKTSLKGTLPPVPTVDSYSDYSTSSKEASGSLRTKLWHDPQVRVWFYLMRGAGFRCEREKQGMVVSSDKRPDIVIFWWTHKRQYNGSMV
jgi:hypothetical protein